MLLALLGASHWLGLWPRMVDAVSGTPGRYDLTGTVRVVDGDTLRMGTVRIRLNAIDAPEKDAVCTVTATGARMACGARAGEVLSGLIGGRTVRCAGEGFDRYGRTLGRCWVRSGDDDIDIARAMVRGGWALAYRRYSNRYALDETQARLEGAGLWATEFEMPEDDRRGGKVSMR